MNLKSAQSLTESPNDFVMSIEQGAEIEEVIKGLLNSKFRCTCNEIIEIKEDSILGYSPHDSGYADKDGLRWWLFIHCSKCRYDWSLWKVIQNRIPLFKKEIDHELEAERLK